MLISQNKRQEKTNKFEALIILSDENGNVGPDFITSHPTAFENHSVALLLSQAWSGATGTFPGRSCNWFWNFLAIVQNSGTYLIKETYFVLLRKKNK